jgi:hypothetical protein
MEATEKVWSDIPENVLNTLTQQWLGSFEVAARAENRAGIMQLFTPHSLICGSQKGGPLDRVMSKSFAWKRKASKMAIYPPYVVSILGWEAPSEVVGGPTYRGDATLFLMAQRFAQPDGKPPIQMFVCMHAHLSLS